jgi:hypothetical protein
MSVNFGKRGIRLFLIAVSGLIPTVLISNLGTNHYLAAFYRKRASELPGNAMPAYRIYTVGDDGNFSNAPEFVVCADDKEAVEKATQIINGRALEIWEHDRLVAQLPVSPPKA